MDNASSPAAKSTTALGVLSGAGAALCWALGFVAARHGVDVGMSPLVIALHRYLWPGLVLLPLAAQDGFSDIRKLGWRRALLLTLFGGLPQAILSYAGFLFVPLGHGGVIQPACASLSGLLLAWLVLREPLPARRIAGASAIVLGLLIIGAEALRTMGMHGVGGDLMFAAAGCSFATFGMLLRLWRVEPMRAVAVTSIISLFGLPALVTEVGNAVDAGILENLLQVVVQGAFAGAGAIYLFARAVTLLGASRAAVIPSLVPPMTLLVGFLTLGVTPSIPQLAGLLIVLIGFRLTQQS
jgi:drug/metabolite transporter (DMT)-like permease